ncbi:radical SAM/SPASM protein FxsBH, inactivated beta-hydroxylase extension form [Streptomyces xanthochromogenes]|uniref:radical SAM/SPASM protein FxsBH, inactivated beta-hydroxylase extension form n=1 Tax=Streptomyces xanthochromogenes TaxID=67384 RepID=UPI0037F951CC
MTGPLVPFREIVLKVHSRCDLACDHCYVYEAGDQTWREQPRAVSDHVIAHTARRLAEHAEKHRLPSVSVILHGGEPLLAGPARLRRVCEELTAAVTPVTALDLRIHTNGVLLGPPYLDLFEEFGVQVGISLDGDRAANDRHRRFADGRSSHPQVLAAVELLQQPRYRPLFLGLLCTVDLANDPVAVHDALVELDPPRIDYLLPHATWAAPPARPGDAPAPYADWLLAAFDRWGERGRTVPVRLFDSVLSTLHGGPSLTESLGLAPADIVVVETDGSLEQVDSLKTAYEGAAATGFSVFRDDFDAVAAHPGVRARQRGLAGVGEQCRRCPVVRSCGGGHYTHRYSAEGGFDNPSVYCPDLMALVHGIEARTPAPELPDAEQLAASALELNRLLLARLHGVLDGRGGPAWARIWELTTSLDGPGLDAALATPYTRGWLLDALAALDQGRPDAGATARRLAAYTVAAAVRDGAPLTLPVPWSDGRLHLPTLGELRLAGPGTAGTAEVSVRSHGFSVRDAHAEHRVPRPDRPTPDWRPLTRVDGLVVDDLDPYRDCFGTPLPPRLDPREAQEWGRRVARARARLAGAVPPWPPPGPLTTLTPLAGGTAPVVGRHGFGALGLPLGLTDRALDAALLRGGRAATLRALLDVADPYDMDGAWRHPSPWGPLPVSRLLAATYEGVAVAAHEGDAGTLAELGPALDSLERAAELTVTGRRLVQTLRQEWEEASRAREHR